MIMEITITAIVVSAGFFLLTSAVDAFIANEWKHLKRSYENAKR